MSDPDHPAPDQRRGMTGAEPELVRLVFEAQAGNTLAMNNLLDRLAPYVGRICGPIALTEAEDATQEALIVVFRSLHGLRTPEALLGWVRTIAVREAFRATRGRPPQGSGELPEIPDPARPLLGIDIRETLAELAPEQRAILVLREIEGLSEREAAALLSIQPGTVKSRLNRARASFRRRWGG